MVKNLKCESRALFSSTVPRFEMVVEEKLVYLFLLLLRELPQVFKKKKDNCMSARAREETDGSWL